MRTDFSIATYTHEARVLIRFAWLVNRTERPAGARVESVPSHSWHPSPTKPTTTPGIPLLRHGAASFRTCRRCS